MAYTPYYSGGWQSGEEGNTPITPDALNHMDTGISGAYVEIDNKTGVVVPADSLFSSRHAKVSEIRARRTGNVMLISVNMADGVPDKAALFTIDTTIQPPAANIIVPLFKQINGELVAYGSVWIEASNNRIVRYYGTQATAGLTCFSFTYIIG
jgi:hypothetical protein